MLDWYIYLIRCSDGSLYTGISTNVERRFLHHQEGGKTGSKYLKGRGPLTLVYKKNVGSKSAALKVEIKVKKLSRPAKEKLIASLEEIQEMIRRTNE